MLEVLRAAGDAKPPSRLPQTMVATASAVFGSIQERLALMKHLLLATLLYGIGHCAFGADTDGDGLLDLIDVPGFDPSASGDVDYSSVGIEDLDGANLLTNATGLSLAFKSNHERGKR
jgi:hypothetical protein